MQDRLHVCENLIPDFHKEKQNLSLNFFPAAPLAVEILHLVLEGKYRKLPNPKKKGEN